MSLQTSMPSRPGKHQVKQHQIGLDLAENTQCLGTVVAEHGFEAIVLQHDADHFGQRLVVVDNQDPCLHNLPFRSLALGAALCTRPDTSRLHERTGQIAVETAIHLTIRPPPAYG